MRKIFAERKIAGIVLLVALGILLFGFIVMTLWNTVLVAALPVAHAINFGQAIGLLVLSKILFGGFRGGGWRGRRGPWGYKMSEKWDSMTPEEREKFRQNWRGRCHKWNDKPETE